MVPKLPLEIKKRFYNLAKATYSLNGNNQPSWSALCCRIGESPELIRIIENFLNSQKIGYDFDDLPRIVIVQPATPKTPTVARIQLKGDLVSVNFPEKRDDFREIVKSLGYTWKRPGWQREINRRAGNPQDRAAELGHHLLAGGFCVVFPSVEIRQAAIIGSYEPEQKRWVLVRFKGKYRNWFALWWRYQEDCYSEAMKLSGARYSPPCVVIPPENFEEIEDFASIHGFQWSEVALEVLEQVRAWRAAAITVSVPEIGISPKPTNGNSRPDLEIPETVEIDDELADDL